MDIKGMFDFTSKTVWTALSVIAGNIALLFDGDPTNNMTALNAIAIAVMGMTIRHTVKKAGG